MDLTDYLINGVADNGTTAVLDADTVGSTEGLLGGAGRAVRRADALLRAQIRALAAEQSRPI